MNKQIDLDDLALRIIGNKVTQKLAENAKQLVMGSGNPDADLVFIGEAPGKKEDEGGEPFIGASGKLLDELFASIGLKRTDVYITNIVKYRPPENRDPLFEEKKQFWPYLLEQLAIIKPKIVATLGRHSGQAFYPSLRIGADHGTVKEIVLNDNEKEPLPIILLPLYHPAAALYNGSLRETLFNDFKKIPALIK